MSIPTCQTFFMSNTHYSVTHEHHRLPNRLVATEWSLGIQDANRPSGFRQYGNALDHVDYVGQTTLDMFTPGGRMNLPGWLNK